MKEQIYRQLIEDSPIPYICIKLMRNQCENGDERYAGAKVLDVNKSFTYTFNKRIEELKTVNMQEHMTPCDYTRLLRNLQEANRNGKHTFRWDHKEDHVLNIEIYTFEKDEYHMKITRMGRSNNELAKIVQNSPFATWIKDRDGRYIEVNKHFLKIFNLKYSDVVGKYAEEIWDEHKAQYFTTRHRQVIKENSIHREMDIIKVPQVGERYFEMVRCPYTDETGNVILGVIGLAIEVTDKVKLKEAIEKNEKHFLDMANNIDELIIIRDEKKALYISPYFETLYGFKPDALYEDMDNWYKHWDLVEFVDEPAPYEYSEIDHIIFRVVKNGEIDKWLQSKFVPIFDEYGNIIRKIGMIKDITDKKKIEEELENLRMEFFSNVSHELRTPINMIMSALQMIHINTSKLDQELMGEMDKYIRHIAQNGRRLIRLVNNLIDTTKINSGNFEYKPTNQNIISFVEDLCLSVADFVERNNLEIIFDTDVEEKIVAFDMNQMERIMLNLISNAIKFNQPEGRIEVTLTTSDGVTISVKDSGIGIPKDRLESIFRRFEQVNKSLRREKEGSGIGLALVKSLVEMHGGAIKVISNLGQGSEFVVTLPDQLIPEVETPMNQSEYCAGENYKIDVEFSDIYC